MPKSQNSDFPARLAVRLAMRRNLVPDHGPFDLESKTKEGAEMQTKTV